MLEQFRGPAWRRRGWWLRFTGIALLVAATFLPEHYLLAALVPGLVLFLLGGFAWLARDREPWQRPR